MNCSQLGLALILLISPLTASAGVFESIHPQTGAPIRWATPMAIPYWLDEGGLGKLSHEDAKLLVEEMMRVWENEGGAAIRFEFKGTLGADVTIDNMAMFVDSSVCADNIVSQNPSMKAGQSPIIFDANGSIIDALSGPGASRKIVGKAAFRCFSGTLANPTAVTQAFLVINGRFMDGKPDPVDLPMNVYAGVILHELGHYLGLHHSMVNESIYDDVLDGRRPATDSKYVPVMYPLILPNAVAATVLKPDDLAIIRELYPKANEDWAAISGVIRSSEGVAVRGANVVARRTDDPLCQAVSAVSGRECTPVVDKLGRFSVLSEQCQDAAHYGDFVVRGLSTGTYSMEVSEIVEGGGARANMFPKSSGQDLPGEPIRHTDKILLTTEIIPELSFTLPKLAEAHQESMDLSSLLPIIASDCRLDPVDYAAMLYHEESSQSLSAPNLNGPASGAGCSVLAQTPQSSFAFLPLAVAALAIVRRRYTTQL